MCVCVFVIARCVLVRARGVVEAEESHKLGTCLAFMSVQVWMLSALMLVHMCCNGSCASGWHCWWNSVKSVTLCAQRLRNELSMMCHFRWAHKCILDGYSSPVGDLRGVLLPLAARRMMPLGSIRILASTNKWRDKPDASDNRYHVDMARQQLHQQKQTEEQLQQQQPPQASAPHRPPISSSKQASLRSFRRPCDRQCMQDSMCRIMCGFRQERSQTDRGVADVEC